MNLRRVPKFYFHENKKMKPRFSKSEAEDMNFFILIIFSVPFCIPFHHFDYDTKQATYIYHIFYTTYHTL